MLSVSVINARPGMTVAVPVFHPETPGHILLRPGFVLDAPSIRGLRSLGVWRVWIKYPPLESVVRYVNPEVIQAHGHLTSLLGEAMEQNSREAKADLDFRSYATAVRCLVTKLGNDPTCQVLIEEMTGGNRALLTHSSNVCFLSLLLGLKLEPYLIVQRAKVDPHHARSVENIGVAGLFHDIGVLRLPPEVIDRCRESDDEEDLQWRSHVRLGYGMVRGHVEPTAAAAIYQHHQRYDGTGYPEVSISGAKARGLVADEIHVFARIVAVADMFDRLREGSRTSGPNGPRRRPVASVLKRMLNEARKRSIDPIVFKGLLHAVPAFPLGSIVTLCDGRQGVVVAFDPLNPCRPSVQTILKEAPPDSPEGPTLGAIYDLAIHTDLTVVEAEGQNVTNDQFAAEEPYEFDLRVLRAPDGRAREAGLRASA